MADRSISVLDPATILTPTDLFVLSQSNQAKSATWAKIIEYLTDALRGHGGISSIVKGSTSENVDTYQITYADNTTSSFNVTNGVQISEIRQHWAVSDSNTEEPEAWSDSVQTMTVEYRYLWSYYTFYFNDGTDIDLPASVVGVFGDTGNSWYVYIKYAENMPTSNSDMSDSPNNNSNYIGIYSGTSSTPPSNYTNYVWYKYKGDKGDTGTSIVSITKTSSTGVVDTYTVRLSNNATATFTVTNGSSIQSITKTGTSGLVDTYTVTLTNGDTTTFTVTNAKSITSIVPIDVTHASGATDVYRINFNDGDTFEFSVYNGSNGTGAVSTVDGIPSTSQDVPLLTFGTGAPTTATQGSLKSRYFDTAASRLYICTGIDTSGVETTYTWAGAGVTTDSAMSTTSTNPVQNAVLTGILGTIAMNTTAQTLKGAINELKSSIDTVTGTVANLRAANIPMTDNQSVQSHVDTLETAVDNLSRVVGNVTLTAANWIGNGPWSQTITLTGETVTVNTKVDLQADATAMAQLQSDDVSEVFAVNSNGITVWARGKYPPRADLTLQYMLSETSKTGNIPVVGNAVVIGPGNFYEITETDFVINTSVIPDVGFANGFVQNGWCMISLSASTSQELSVNGLYTLLTLTQGLKAKIGRTYRSYPMILSGGKAINITINTWDTIDEETGLPTDNRQITITPFATLSNPTQISFNILFPVSYNAKDYPDSLDF